MPPTNEGITVGFDSSVRPWVRCPQAHGSLRSTLGDVPIRETRACYCADPLNCHTRDMAIVYDRSVKSFAACVAEFIEAQEHRTDVSSNEDSAVCHIEFRTRGIWMNASSNENDRGYLQISYSFPIAEQIEIDKIALQILLGVQNRLKAMKFTPIGAERLLVGNFELLFETEDGFKPVFWRSVGIIETAMREAIGALEDNSAAKTAADKFIKTLSLGGTS